MWYLLQLYDAGYARGDKDGYRRGLEAALSHCDADSYEFDAIQRLIDAEKPPASQERGRG